MLKFLKDGSLVGLAENPNWVRLMDNGVYGLCPFGEAHGVVLNGAVYNLPGNNISENGEVYFVEVAVGEYMMQQDRVAAQNAANVDYLSMMTGFSLPTGEAETNDSEVAADE